MWDKRYSKDEYVYGTEPNTFLKENYSQIPKGKVLCLAEGEGRNAVFLAKQGYDVTAVDSSSVGLEKAQKLADKNEVTIKCIHADLADFEIETEKWDGIISIFCHLPPPLRKDVYRNVMNGLKAGGVVLIEGYTPNQLSHGTGGPKVAEMMISKEILTEELKGIHFSHLIEMEREIIEGSLHSGLGAVVQAIGSK